MIVVFLFRWVRRVWLKVTRWAFFWRHRTKPSLLEHSGSKKHVLKGVQKTSTEFETIKSVKSSKLDECPKVPEPCVPDTATDGHAVSLKRRSLVQLSQTAVHSISMIMYSLLQSGWKMCRWKSSVSSASVSSLVRTQSTLGTPEAEMLREVFLVLWVIRKQLRELAHRQERRRRRYHMRTHSSHQPNPVQGRKQNARSSL